MSIVFSSKLFYVPADQLYSASNFYTGYAIFWGGITVGACNLICGISVGINGSSAALADAADPTLYVELRDRCKTYCLNENNELTFFRACRFVKILVIEIFSSVLGLFGLIIGLLVSGKAHDFS
jgi:V-type H+-transporting ATPase proteolipid subunit